jgi:hypothetical protein
VWVPWITSGKRSETLREHHPRAEPARQHEEYDDEKTDGGGNGKDTGMRKPIVKIHCPTWDWEAQARMESVGEFAVKSRLSRTRHFYFFSFEETAGRNQISSRRCGAGGRRG